MMCFQKGAEKKFFIITTTLTLATLRSRRNTSSLEGECA